MEEAFASPSERWRRVSPRLRTARRLLLLAVVIPGALLVFAVVALVVAWWLGVLVLVVNALLAGWGWWLIGRNWRSWGYAERAEDLLVTQGVLLRRLTVVPYGRMQFVDVTAGPLDRRFRIAKVQLHTASAHTDAYIPGLPPGEAARLRDRLAALGQAQSAGL